MRTLKRCWYPVYAILWVCLQLLRTNAYPDHPKAIDTRYIISRIASDEEVGFQKRLIPIKSPKAGGTNFAMFSMPLDPDAEMLPAHYTGVKPPGVDHMELKYAESRPLKARSNSGRFEENGGGKLATTKQTSKGEAEEGRRRVTAVEKQQKDNDQAEKRRTEYVDAAGKKKVIDERNSDSRQHGEEARRTAGASHRRKDSGNKKQKALGFHNVYHKDEYKKDHDFFDNDHHGGHLKKHGRYDERHVAVEGTFKKGGDRDSSVDQTGTKKQGISGKSQADREAKGHDARRGYDGFFKNFQGFGKQTAKGEGRKFGFAGSKMR